MCEEDQIYGTIEYWNYNTSDTEDCTIKLVNQFQDFGVILSSRNWHAHLRKQKKRLLHSLNLSSQNVFKKKKKPRLDYVRQE